MSNVFNPYTEWLNVSAESGQPNHYQLLGLQPFESDTRTIAQAAGEKLSILRSIRPGEHVAIWTRLIDEVNLAKKTLSDPKAKAAYDTAIQNGTAIPSAASAPPAIPTAVVPPTPVAPPTAMAPPSATPSATPAPPPAATQATSQPIAQSSAGELNIPKKFVARKKKSKLPVFVVLALMALLIGGGVTAAVLVLMKSDDTNVVLADATDGDGIANDSDKKQNETKNANSMTDEKNKSKNTEADKDSQSNKNKFGEKKNSDKNKDANSDNSKSNEKNSKDKTETQNESNTESTSSNSNVAATKMETRKHIVWLLRSARRAMARNQLVEAQSKIDSAKALAGESDTAPMIGHHMDVLESLSKLIAAVEEQCLVLKATDEIPVGQSAISIIESNDGKLAFITRDSRRWSFPYNEIPPNIMLAILNSNQSLPPKDLATFQAVLYTVNAWENPFLEAKAAARVQKAIAAGEDCDALEYLSDFAKIDQFEQTPGPPKHDPPNPSTIRNLNAKLSRNHNLASSNLRKKVNAAARANELCVASFGYDDTNSQFLLLNAALRAAMKSGDPNLAEDILDERARHFQVDLIKERQKSAMDMVKNGFQTTKIRPAIHWIVEAAEAIELTDDDERSAELELLNIAIKLAQENNELDLVRSIDNRIRPRAQRSGSLKLN